MKDIYFFGSSLTGTLPVVRRARVFAYIPSHVRALPPVTASVSVNLEGVWIRGGALHERHPSDRTEGLTLNTAGCW